MRSIPGRKRISRLSRIVTILPKRAGQEHLTQADCDALAKELNSRPRKRLGYRTPEECFLGI